jgi:hypothetical protein
MRAINIVGLSVSPFTGETQAQEWPGEMWQIDGTLPPMARADAEEWLSFLIALRGSSGTFYYGDPSVSAPRGVATGTPLVNGANAAGSKTLVTKGWTHSIAGILKKGDYLQIGSGTSQRLYKVVYADVDSDGSGDATIDIFPRLREALADGDAITTSNCRGVFRLAVNAREWSISTAKHYGLTFKAIEAL